MRVLLIEDDSSIAQSIELMLKSESFNVYATDLGDANIIVGATFDESLEGIIRVSVVATGVEIKAEQHAARRDPKNVDGVQNIAVS